MGGACCADDASPPPSSRAKRGTFSTVPEGRRVPERACKVPRFARDDGAPVGMIHLLFTGGTISMQRDAAAGGNVPAHAGEALVGFTTGLDAIAPFRIENWAKLPACHL